MKTQLLLGQNSFPLHGFGALHLGVSNPLFFWTYCLLPHLISVHPLSLNPLNWSMHCFSMLLQLLETCVSDWNSLTQSSFLCLWDTNLFYNKCRGLIWGNCDNCSLIAYSPVLTRLNLLLSVFLIRLRASFKNVKKLKKKSLFEFFF